MFHVDPEKLAKEGLKQLGKSGVGDAAKTMLDGLANTEAVSEQVISALRDLLAKAKALNAKSNNAQLSDCIAKCEQLLERGDSSVEAITKLSAELGALLKGEDGAKGSDVEKTDTVQNKNFSDVSADAYYYDAVQWAVSKGITSGTSDTTFGPDEACTRAQAIVFLWRAAGSPAPNSASGAFSDVADTAFYCQAAQWASERGIVSGDTFDPDKTVTRAQMAAFLYRDAGSPSVTGGAQFSDVAEDAYYAQAVAWVAEKGITSGAGENKFDPDGACTRGQIVTFLHRAKK